MVPGGNKAKESTDCFSRAKRSWVMSQIRSKGNEKTEVRLGKLMRVGDISGWRMHLPIAGRPDFSFQNQKVAVFVDGCYWHGCPRCFRLPKQNRAFWKAKIEGSWKRARLVNGRLWRLGWGENQIGKCQFKAVQKKTLTREKVSSVVFCGAQHVGVRA
jgi:DNA mismatch endonuclease (patch repair protein)